MHSFMLSLVFCFLVVILPADLRAAPLQDLELSKAYGISASLGQKLADYHFLSGNNAYRGTNPDQHFSASIDASGMTLSHDAYSWSLQLQEVVSGGQVLNADSAATPPRLQANRLEFDAGLVTSWYVNGPWGLQQGWTIRSRGQHVQAGDGLVLKFTISGDLRASVQEDQRNLVLVDASGVQRVRYGGLLAYDAAGNDLPCRMEYESFGVRIVVDDRDAVYPVTVDPWVQSEKYFASDPAVAAAFGCNVKCSADGSVIAVGAYDVGKGAAYIFESGSTVKITGDVTNSKDFGRYIDLSADGATLVVGDIGTMSVWVYERSGAGSWSNTARLTNGTSTQYIPAVSGDGSVIAVSQRTESVGGVASAGQVYVFLKPASGWADIGFPSADGILMAADYASVNSPDGNGGMRFGFSLDLSSDGNTLAVGAVRSDCYYDYATSSSIIIESGSVYVFEKGSGWQQYSSANQVAKLTKTDHSSMVDSVNGRYDDWLGSAVAISADASTIVGGAFRMDDGRGYAYVFEKGSGWKDGTETAKLSAAYVLSGQNNYLSGHHAIGISENGGVVALGTGYVDLKNSHPYGNPGAAYLYQRGTAWQSRTETMYIANTKDYDFGSGIALSADGAQLLVGAMGEDVGSYNGAGAVYVHTKSSSASTQASNLVIENVTPFGMTLSWTRGSGSRCLVLANAGTSVAATPALGSFYNANAEFGLGSTAGNGAYAVYNGTDNRVRVKGLTPQTVYTFAVYEYDDGDIYTYQTSSPATATSTTTPVPLDMAAGLVLLLVLLSGTLFLRRRTRRKHT